MLFLGFGLVGMIVAWHQPRNPMGWVLLGVTFFLVLSSLGDAYAYVDYRLHGGRMPLGWLAVLVNPSWTPAIVLAGLALMLFPDGRILASWPGLRDRHRAARRGVRGPGPAGYSGVRFHNSVAVAAATLVAAALFNPVRSLVQRAVDHRFNRARYDADQTVAAFAARLQDAVDLGTVHCDLLSTVGRALEPAHVTVWTAATASRPG